MSDSLWPHELHSPWNSPGQNTGVGSLSLLQGIFPTQGSNPVLLHCRRVLYQLNQEGSPRIMEWVAYPFSTESSQPRNRTRVSFIAGRFFTNWAMRESPAGSREPKRQIDTAPSSPGLICRQMQNSQNANNESKVVRILKSFPSRSGMNLNLWMQTYKLIFKICFEKESLSYLLLSISFFRIPVITVIFRWRGDECKSVLCPYTEGKAG